MATPTLNILVYRYLPPAWQDELQECSPERRQELNRQLDRLTIKVQKAQRSAGKSFVSRTRLSPGKYQGERITVFRVVLANPLTTIDTLQSVLQEQRELAGGLLVD